jgi:hypothetical protein
MARSDRRRLKTGGISTTPWQQPSACSRRPSADKARRRNESSDLVFQIGAGDGNRTRTISLGICAIRASTGLDLRSGLSVSDRERPRFTLVNGPLMARRRDHVDGPTFRFRCSGCPAQIGSARVVGCLWLPQTAGGCRRCRHGCRQRPRIGPTLTLLPTAARVAGL